MAKIQYANKQLYEARPDVPEDKKMTWQNVNEIKESVNALYDMLDAPHHYPTILVDGNDDLEVGDVLKFRSTLEGDITAIRLMCYDAPDGNDVVVKVKIGISNSFITILDNTLTATVTLTPPISVSVGDVIEVEVMQVGSVNAGKGLTMDLLIKNII